MKEGVVGGACDGWEEKRNAYRILIWKPEVKNT
jgi:hypothetical protein